MINHNNKEEYGDRNASDFSRTMNQMRLYTHTYTEFFSNSIEFSMYIVENELRPVFIFQIYILQTKDLYKIILNQEHMNGRSVHLLETAF